MRYTVLGPLEVFDQGTVVPIDRPRRRAVLTFLLLNANHQVCIEQLVDALWGERPPRSARGQVHTAVSALRKLLPGAAAGHATADDGGPLASLAGGYRLSVGRHDLDTLDFWREVAEARRLTALGEHTRAVQHLRTGLGLWRGAALTGIDAPFVEPFRARLEEERFAAYELLADIELGAGRHQELVPELTAMVDRYPARERLVERLVLALYRSGRQTDALAAARRLRTLLADEFGLDPGTALVELESAVLRGDPALTGPRRHTRACAPRLPRLCRQPARTHPYGRRTGR
ncbi:AfsR/SARP family transcriptional regulator [Kitasatospora sp. A2-31]|uniref:AfsR/SARP family transcriptional regulator n=1 Tax=Kitasatospora sp. A2-31 TaxID=2916414 RepID=UPI001EECF1A4|nr:AfsR/SARP family transcriptional regulator [Kitasatospora sp. A2-31]MCG6495649.1 AfsR/SARP family transcriptional regulator [Kitasatospora sp. A2-31]